MQMRRVPGHAYAAKTTDVADGCPPSLAQRLARLRGRSAAYELHPGRGRTERDADRDQPSDPAAGAGGRRQTVRAAESRARADAGRSRLFTGRAHGVPGPA